MRRWMLLLCLVSACSSEPVPQDPAGNSALLMRAHFARAADIRDAAVNGDLPRLRRSAEDLALSAAHPRIDAGRHERLIAMRNAAVQLSAVDAIETAGLQTARLARMCGDCHAAAGVDPNTPDYDVPVWGDGPERYMLRHAWAAARMWEGLITGSNTRWRQGAVILAERPLGIDEYLEDQPMPAELKAFDDAVNALAEEAILAGSADEKVRIYGTFISQCAQCHAAVRTLKDSPAG